MKMPDLAEVRLGVVGLGYVGLPLSVAFAAQFDVIGFDTSPQRIAELDRGEDLTGEIDRKMLSRSKLRLTSSLDDLGDRNVFIVCVPTPIDAFNRPDLEALIAASEAVGRILKAGNTVIYESTVYPGATEEDCVPVLERVSGLQFNTDFCVGYSPERINPGDDEKRFETIVKVTSGSTPNAARFVDKLYGQVVTAGTYKAASIRIAEAAKVIENIQRDLNIALVNELAIIFRKLDLDTLDVLEAAGTKWNFLPFRPGLVGGHCIGVDPYYLTHKALEAGHHAQVILSGRQVNDAMGAFVSSELVKMLGKRGRQPTRGMRVLVLGLTFKENCRDLRNTRVVDIVTELRDFGVVVDVCDPLVCAQAALDEYGLSMVSEPAAGAYDGVIVAVGHDVFKNQGAKAMRRYLKPDGVLFDLKGLFPRDLVDARL